MICQTPRTARPCIAVLTTVSGEHDHLLGHVDGLSVSSWPPDLHVATSVRDHMLTRGRLPIRSDRWTTVVPVLPVPRSRDPFLPSLQAGAQAALQGGADVLVFLSVNAIPSRRLLEVFAEAVISGESSTPTIWHSTMDRLGPAPPVGYPVAGDLDALLLPAHPNVPGRTVGSEPRWCDSFAMTARDWRRVLPEVLRSHPFDGTSSDVEDVITASSGQFRLVSGATAYLQHTPLQDLPMPATA